MARALALAVARSMQNGAFQHRNNTRAFNMKQSLSALKVVFLVVISNFLRSIGGCSVFLAINAWTNVSLKKRPHHKASMTQMDEKFTKPSQQAPLS